MGKFQTVGNYKGRNFDPAFRKANTGHNDHIVHESSTRQTSSFKKKLDKIHESTPREWGGLPARNELLPGEWDRLPIRRERPPGVRDKFPAPRANQQTSPSASSSSPNNRGPAPPSPRNPTAPAAAVTSATLTPQLVEMEESFELTKNPWKIDKQFPVTISGNLGMIYAIMGSVDQHLRSIEEWISLVAKEQPPRRPRFQKLIKRMRNLRATTIRENDYYHQIYDGLFDITDAQMQMEFIQEAQKYIMDSGNTWVLAFMKVVDTAQCEPERGQSVNPVLVTTPTLTWVWTSSNPTVGRDENPESSATLAPSSTQTSLAIDGISQATAVKRKVPYLEQNSISPHKRRQDEDSLTDIQRESQPVIVTATAGGAETVPADIAPTVNTPRETNPWQQSQRTGITNSPIDISPAQPWASLDAAQEESATTKESIINTGEDTADPNKEIPSVPEPTIAVLFDSSSVISTPIRASMEKDIKQAMSAPGSSEDLSTKGDATTITPSTGMGTTGTISSTVSLHSISSSVESAGKAGQITNLSTAVVETAPRSHLTFQQELTLLREEAREQRSRTDQMMLLLHNEATQRHQAEQRLAEMAAQLQEEGMKALKRDLEAKRAEAMTMMYKAQVDMREASAIASKAREERAEALYKAARAEAENEKLLRRMKEMECRYSGSKLNEATELLQLTDVPPCVDTLATLATMETAADLFKDSESEAAIRKQVTPDLSDNEDPSGESTSASDDAEIEASNNK
ncbi:hypothetical protein EDD21DRAFT_361679 [Dissophora ornata]|nr:hypothetical protein EDD21DRAFT_361679 [Dissophora ornata]